MAAAFNAPALAVTVLDAAALYVEDGTAPDDFDQTPAAAFSGGRYACHDCADNRDACERAERELERAQAQLAKAHALLRLIARAEARPAKREGIEDAPHELALIGFAQAFAAIKARIEIYFQAALSR